MKVGIMQPYFVPYIGYWQLLNLVDKYVIYDDVNFIKGGWINRNRILLNNQVAYFNIPMIGASSNKKINEVLVNNDVRLAEKNKRRIESAYSKAPYYAEVKLLLDNILDNKSDNLAEYITASIRMICDYLDIDTEIIVSSELDKNNDLTAQDKVIDICKRLNATEYYNAVGGMELYSYEEFRRNNISLNFLKTNNITYKQFQDEFEGNLSIIDVLMFNSKEQVKQLLNEYIIVSE